MDYDWNEMVKRLLDQPRYKKDPDGTLKQVRLFDTWDETYDFIDELKEK